MSEASSNIVSDTLPINLAEEYAKFLSNKTYNPQFVYRREIAPNELLTWGRPKKAFYEHAKKMIEYWKSEGKRTHPLHSPVVTEEFIAERIQAFNKTFHLTTPVDVRFTTHTVTRCSIDKNTITFLQPVKYTKATLLGLLRHELETHYLRRHNHELQSWGDFPDQVFRQTEEGLANLHTFLFREEKLILKTYRMYVAVYLAQQLSFAELFNELTSLDMNDDLAFRLTLRTKRGIQDTSQPGGLTKDISYFEGSVAVWEWLMNRDNAPEDLYLGRIGLHQIKELKPQAHTEHNLYPTFFADKEKYHESIAMIGERNNFTHLIQTLAKEESHVSSST